MTQILSDEYSEVNAPMWTMILLGSMILKF